MAKKNEYTEERLLQAYDYEMRREKSNRENGNQESTAGTTYTQKNLLDAYYKETGHRISEPAYSTPKKSYAKKTVQADERMTLQKMQENAKQLGDNKDQYGMFSPQEAIMNASLQKHLNADSLSNPLFTKMTANTISDEAMNVAINMLKNKQTEADHEFSDKFMSGQMISDELPAQMKNYKDALNVYETEKEARAVAQENERQEMYNTRREKILEELPEDARKLVDTYTESEAMYNATTISNADAMMRLNYSKAMQDAKTQLSEEYGIEGAELQRVLQYAKELSDKENTEELQSQVQKDIEEHPVLAGAAYTAMDVLASPATGIMAATESLKRQGYADRSAPVNTNSAEYGLMNFSNTTEQAVNKQIENPVGRFAYNVGTSTAKSALSAAIGGEVVGALGLTGTAASLVGNLVTLPQFGASAYASTLQEDQEKGISTENATKHAVAAGVGEMLFEVASLDKVWAIANKSGKVAAKQVLMDILVEAGIEGSEEGFTDIWNRVADDIINGSQSDYNMSVNAYIKSGYSEEEARAQASKDFYAEVALDVLAGAASGGIMGGGANIVSAVNYHNLGKYVDGNTELKQSVYDAAMSMNEDSMTRQIIQDKSADEMTAADMADVLHAMTEESEMDTEQILEERFVELGESKKEAKADARRVIEAVSTPSEEVTEEEHEARSSEFAANENLATVYAETLKGELTKPQDAVRTAQESYSSSKYYDNLIKRGKTDGTGIARATINATGEEMDVIEIHELSNGKAVVRMKDNSLKNLEDIQIEDPVKQSLYNFAASMEDVKAANAVIEEYKGQSLASYAEACAVFYNAGKVGATSFENMMSNPKNSALVSNMSSPATLQRMYFMGENNRSAKKEKVAPVQQKKSEKQSAGKAVREEGKVIDNRTDKSDSRMADVAKQVAKRTGLEITLNDSLANGENGHFQKSLARIALSEMADNQYTTLVHEINEFAETYNPEGMKQVIDTVLDYAQTEEGAAFLFGKENGIIQRYQNVYRQRVEADKTYEGAAEEFVFDYLSGVFSSKEGVEDFSRYMTEEGMSQKEQKGILETIADFFKELADKITSYLDEHVLSKTAQKGLQADAEKAREIRQMVMDVWQQAEENYQSRTVVESEKSFSIIIDEDGIENYNTTEETKALSYKERQKKLLDVMRNEYAGRTAKFTKEGKVYYALYDRMSLKKGVYGDKKSDAAGKKAKINIGADGNYIELAENALYSKSSIEQGKNKEFHKNAKTWDYYLKTIKSDGFYYSVLINVKDTGNEQYVYDITLRKQENKKSSPLTNYGLKGGRTTSYTHSIPQPSEKSTKKYSIDVDDSLFSTLQETYSAQEEEFASIIQEGFASLKNVTVNEKVMHKVAYDIKKAYKSSYDINKLQENLTRVFAYLKDNSDTVGYADMVRIVQEIAKPVIEQSTDVDAFEQELYNNFRAYLKGRRIRLSEEQKAEVAYYYGSYENFRKKNLGNITFSDEGTYLDNIWSEICDNSYQMLDIEILTADEPIALIDALNTLRPTKKNIYGMDTEQAAYDLALDIYRRFFVEQAEENANRKVNEKAQRLIVRQQEYRKRVKQEYDASLQRLREAEQQKRRNLAEKYEQKIHDLKEDQKAMRYYSDVKASKEIERKVNYYTKKLVETNQKANDRILQIKASNRENMINKRRNEELRQYRERIKKNAQGIITMFNTNTDKKHVPEVLKEPVANFITSIDFVSERAATDSAATLAWQDALNQMHRKLSDREAAVDGGYIELYNALHDWEGESRKTSALLSDISAFIDTHYSMRLSAMNIEDLSQLNELVTGLKRAIVSVNQLYVNKRTKNVQELGSSTVNELSEKKKRASKSQLGEMAENLLEVDMLDSRSYFYRLGDSAFSIYEGLRNGFSERVWMLKEAQQYMEKELDGLDVKKWTGDKAEVHKMIIQGKELYMTTGQIMSLYELKNRYQAKMHLRNGGIRPSKIGKGKNAIERVTPLKLTDYEIDMICKELTPEQKKAADAMQRFMAENCAEWGNKTSMLMYGYKRFEASNYFPIKTDGNSVDTRDDSKYYGTKNQGFTKETTSNASNAVIVSDIFDVFTKHVTDMASYSAFTAPLMDAMKWFNYRNVSYDGDIAVYGESVKSEIERAYGAQYLEYFKKLIKDINAETSRGFESQISDTLTSRMKAASVGANVRVAIQQPTAYVRAMAVMDPKYLVKALPKKSQIKKAQENSAITQWKSWGYFETSIGMSMKNVITGQDTLKNKVVEKSMTLAQIGDDVTWGYLWNACEAEIKDKHPEVQYDSEEFLKLVSERFDDVVDQTQVVDSVLHRSHIMRSDNGIVKMATSFMAEPTKSYNMLMNQLRDVHEGGGKAAKKRLGNAVVAYCVTGLLNAAVVSIVDAARDMDDDDDTYWERYFDALGDNIKDNLNPFGMIPYIKDILSILQGYDVERMDMQGISNVITGAQKLYKYIKDEEYRQKHTLWDVSKTLIRGTSQVLGIPIYNALRDLESAVYTITGVRIGGIKRSNTRNYELMVDAVLEEDEEKQDDIREELEKNGIGAEDLKSGLQSYVKKSFMDGELSEEDVAKFYSGYFGTDDSYAEEKIVEWKTGGIEDDYKDEVITEEEAEAGLEELGTEIEDAEDAIRGWKVDIIKDNYLNGWITQEEAENELEKVEGLEAEEIYSNLKEWNYKIENPLASYSKNVVLYDAIDYAYSTGNIDDRDAIKEEITELMENGSEKKDITRAITSRYKSQYLELKAAGRCADMKNLLISAYMMAGLSWNEAVEKIDGWEEVEEE